MEKPSVEELLARIQELESRLQESEQLVEAIKAGEVDAFAVNKDNQHQVFTLQTADYVYRLLIENLSEGALNLSEDGLIIYANAYFPKLLGVPYEEIVGNYIFNFVHPDCIEKFKTLFQKGWTGQSKGEIIMAVNERAIPAYISFTSLYPTLPSVGLVVTDLTEKKKQESVILQYQRELESKNQELTRSNTQLASFAYVASHDLHEPLRKIRTFINIILDKKSEGVPASIKDYLDRISRSAERMQNLMDALLEYSRTNTSQMVFKSTDLNALVEGVKKDLDESIKETDAVIETAPLPELKVVPHQVNQLFNNLILNAIKYRKPSVPPHIKITAQMANGNDAFLHAQSTNGKFLKVSVADNGIGFEQQYAEKIFELFQRLHGKGEYDGTGIGLAICKNIVQNHNGYITAEGRPGEGATFNIYLPVSW